MASACLQMVEPAVQEEGRRRGFLNPANADGYLKGSHFSIGHDERLNENCLQTAYKRDYPPLPLHGRPPPIRHQATDKLLPVDDRYLPEQVMTETQAEYTKKAMEERPDIEMLKQRLGATHYKQHKDEKSPAWLSTHKADYVPLATNRVTLAKAVESGNLVFGDRGKAEKPVTSYKSAYLDFSGENAKSDPVKQAGGPPTISGDVRATTYSTTNKDHFVPLGGQVPTSKVIKPAVDLFGTRGKPFEGVSEFSAKYTEKSVDRPAASEHRSWQTTFRQDDGRGLDEWSTTHKESYVPQAYQMADKVAKDSNKSNVPLGGKTPGEEMISNYQRNYLEWQVKPNECVNRDSEYKYKSQVVFGDPAEASKFFETTHAATYQPFATSRPVKANKELQQSHLPLDNWADEVNIPTYNDDYRHFKPTYEKRPDRVEVIGRLQKSNLQFPVDDDLHWRTTHKSHFTPKRAASEKILDGRRFQNSSIAFGDPRITPFKKDCY